jgi:hypothetical protein
MSAKIELNEMLEELGCKKMKCATITYSGYRIEDQNFNLKVNHTEEELNVFLTSLDFDYDSGYGTQELFGTVWFEDGTWLSRAEYDGLEWWVHNQLPEIPSELL